MMILSMKRKIDSLPSCISFVMTEVNILVSVNCSLMTTAADLFDLLKNSKIHIQKFCDDFMYQQAYIVFTTVGMLRKIKY